MKTKLLAITAVFVSISAYSQEIKIKKGELLLDNKAVAKVDDKGRLYKFSDMNGKLQFDATLINGRTIGTQSDNGWVEYTGTNGHVKEANHIEGTFTLSMGKLIVQNAIANGLITKDGINEAKVNEFFTNEDRSLSDARKNGITSQKTEAKSEDALGTSVDINGNIKNDKGEIIGFLTRTNIDASQSQFSSSSMMDKYLEYRVFDLNKILIAKLQCSDSDMTNEDKGLKIYTYDNKEIPMAAKNGMNFQKLEFFPLPADKIADRIVKKLYANGYTLGDMKPVFEGMAKEKNDALNTNTKEVEKLNNLKEEKSNDDVSDLIEKMTKILDQSEQSKSITRDNYTTLKGLQSKLILQNDNLINSLKNQSLLDSKQEEQMKNLVESISKQIKELECCVKDSK